MADVWFARARSETPPPQISDLLAEAPTDLAPAAAADTTASTTAAAAAVASVVKPNYFEEELLKNQPLI